MAADVNIIEKNGSTPTPTTTDKTGGTVRFKNADDANVDNNDPLQIPSSGQEYSYEKWLRFNFATAPDTEITNLEFYMDGANNYRSGVKLWYATDPSYSTPQVPTESNDPPEHDASPMSDAFGATSGSPVSLGSGPFTGTGEKGDHLVAVMEVEPGASPGTLSAETATFEYDEI